MMATLIKIDRNGTKYFAGLVTCDRCGGAGGADQWKFTGWKCYKCGGTGKIAGTWKEYTPEYEAKLQARREAKEAERMAKWQAEQAVIEAEAEAKRQAEEAERQAEEERIKAQKAISKHVGQIGDKIEMKLYFVFSASWEQPSFGGYGMDTMHAHIFKDAEGNKFVWKTTKWIGIQEKDKHGDFSYRNYDEGQALIVKATIKDHSEYDGEKQTVLTRCKITLV